MIDSKIEQRKREGCSNEISRSLDGGGAMDVLAARLRPPHRRAENVSDGISRLLCPEGPDLC